MTSPLEIGQFVKVGNDVGVVVGLAEDMSDIPDAHVAVWFGELTPHGQPRARTVPVESADVHGPVVLDH